MAGLWGDSGTKSVAERVVERGEMSVVATAATTVDARAVSKAGRTAVLTVVSRADALAERSGSWG